MTPAEVTPQEARQFTLLVMRSGADVASFHVNKLRKAEHGYRTRVVGRAAATVYDCVSSTDWMAAFAADLARGIFGNARRVPTPTSVETALRGAEAALAHSGLLGVLQFLNRRVPHRFTALYRLEHGTVLRSVGVVDKHLHLDELDLRSVPLRDSFCQFVLRDGVFLTENSGSDVRLDGHPYSGIVGCYVGVAVKRLGSGLAGTLCHFDTESHPISDDEYLLLDRVAQLLPAFLNVVAA
jgi:hypothetical protein